MSETLYKKAQSERFCRIDEARRAFRRQHPRVRSMSRMPGNPCIHVRPYRDDSILYGALRNAECAGGGIRLPAASAVEFDHYTVADAMVEWQARRDNRVAFEAAVRDGLVWSY